MTLKAHAAIVPDLLCSLCFEGFCVWEDPSKRARRVDQSTRLRVRGSFSRRTRCPARWPDSRSPIRLFCVVTPIPHRHCSIYLLSLNQHQSLASHVFVGQSPCHEDTLPTCPSLRKRMAISPHRRVAVATSALALTRLKVKSTTPSSTHHPLEGATVAHQSVASFRLPRKACLAVHLQAHHPLAHSRVENAREPHQCQHGTTGT